PSCCLRPALANTNSGYFAVGRRHGHSCYFFFPRIPPRPFVTFLAPGICPLARLVTSPFAKPATTPPTSGINFGFDVVPSIANGIPPFPLVVPATFDRPPTMPPCRSAIILKARSPPGLTVPALVITPIAGTERLLLSAIVPRVATCALGRPFWTDVFECDFDLSAV